VWIPYIKETMMMMMMMICENALPVIDLKTKLTKYATISLHGRYPQQINQLSLKKKPHIPGRGEETYSQRQKDLYLSFKTKILLHAAF
jgi:hypothetical protein